MSFKSKRKPKNRHKNPKSKQSIVPISGTISTFKKQANTWKEKHKNSRMQKAQINFHFFK